MIITKLMKNGSINLPAELRKKLNISAGDKISFIETEQGFVLVPIVDIFDLVDSNNMEKTIEIIEEIKAERENLAKEESL